MSQVGKWVVFNDFTCAEFFFTTISVFNKGENPEK